MNLILDEISLHRNQWSLSASGEFHKGIHLITGDVGCGKSTLALTLAGFFPPKEGDVKKRGIASEMLSFQFPEYHITGRNLFEECRSWGLDPGAVLQRERIPRTPDTDPLTLSRGELKRLHLACVLEKKYDLLILDEPFSSLDCAEKERLCRILSGIDDSIVIIFTHEQSHFPRVDYIWEILEGRLIFRGKTPDAIVSWSNAPEMLRQLVASGRIPKNISYDDVREAVCRM